MTDVKSLYARTAAGIVKWGQTRLSVTEEIGVCPEWHLLKRKRQFGTDQGRPKEGASEAQHGCFSLFLTRT